MPLNDFQILLPTGDVVGAGTAVGLKEINGLRALPDLGGGDTTRGQMDGYLTGPTYLGERAVQFTFQIFDPTNGLEAAIQTLTGAWQNVRDATDKAMTVGEYLTLYATGNPKPVSSLQVKLPGRALPLLLLGRPSRLSLPVDKDYQFRNPTITAEWKVPDGVLYDANIETGVCGLPNPVAGFTFPATPPFTFGSSTGGGVTLTNYGKYPTYPVVKITGPCIHPKVTLGSTGEYVGVNLSLTGSDVVTIDMQSKVVEFNGVNRNNAVDAGSSFFMAPPGSSTIGFSSTDSVSVAGTMAAYLLSTYSVI